MDTCDVLIEEYEKIDTVPFWSEAEKNAARAVLRGVAAGTGNFREFAIAVDKPSNVVVLKAVRRKLEAGETLASMDRDRAALLID